MVGESGVATTLTFARDRVLEQGERTSTVKHLTALERTGDLLIAHRKIRLAGPKLVWPEISVNHRQWCPITRNGT